MIYEGTPKPSTVPPLLRADGTPVRVAITHDYLTQRGGAERVVLAMLRAFPGSTLYTTFYEPTDTYPEFAEHRIVTSVLDRFPALRRRHRWGFPLLRTAVDRFGPVPADVIISSTSGWGHGFKSKGATIVYCHSPARWLYQPTRYFGGSPWRSPKGWVLLLLRPGLVAWDARSAGRADRYLANSRVVRARVKNAYGRVAEVLHPPFGVAGGDERAVETAADWEQDGFYLLVSRLLPYKNVDRAIAAFRGLDERLLVIGHGPLKEELVSNLPDNVRIVSDLDDAQMRWAYARCRVLVAPSHEDFGLTPLEAATFGKPTIALRAGGYLDTVVEGRTGWFFEEPTEHHIRAAVLVAQSHRLDPEEIVAHAQTFREERFATRLRQIVSELVEDVPPPHEPADLPGV